MKKIQCCVLKQPQVTAACGTGRIKVKLSAGRFLVVIIIVTVLPLLSLLPLSW